MHDGGAPAWRQILDQHHETLAETLTTQLNSEIEMRVSGAVETVRARAAEELSSALSAERSRTAASMAAAVAAEHLRMDAEAAKAVAQAIDETRESAAKELTRALAQERAGSRAELENAQAHLHASVGDTRRRLAESLNQTLRRIRQTSAEHETLQLLLEGSSDFADRAVVLLIENNQASVAAWRNVSLREEEEDHASIELRDAAAIASCAETHDPVVAIASPDEVTSLLAAALSPGGDGKIYLFPVVARQNTVAMLLACGSVAPSANELLCEISGMRLESFSAVPAAEPVPLVQISTVAVSKSKPQSAGDSWLALTPQEQATHLRAQRMARVRVAQIRISESDALRKGIQAGDIYSAVRPSIDGAREDYRQAYTSQSATMVDYLHLEIVRSLARDNVGLLGHDYPGPIV